MAPKLVAPYRKSGKNDGNDAEATTFRGIDRKWFDVHDHIWQALKQHGEW